MMVCWNIQIPTRTDRHNEGDIPTFLSERKPINTGPGAPFTNID